MMTDKKGFTLVELLVSITIIAILITIAGLSGRTWLNRYRVESQMNVMSTDLMNARVNAMQRNRTYFVVFNPTPTATSYTIFEDTSPAPEGNGTYEPADRQVSQRNLNSTYALTIPNATSTSINFFPKGMVSMSPGPMGLEQTIRVAASFAAAYDCIVIYETKIRMGAWNGTTCVQK